MKRLLFAFVCALIVSGCSRPSRPTVAPNVTASQKASASKSMGLSFPAETEFLLYQRASEGSGLLPAPDDCVHLKIKIPASALAKLLDQPPLASAKWSETGSSIGDVKGWPEWQSSTVKKYRFQQFPMPNAEYLHVLIDDDRDDFKVVYLFWHQT